MLLIINLLVVAAIGFFVWAAMELFKQRSVLIKLPEDTQKTHKIEIRSKFSKLFPFTQQLLGALKLDVKIKRKLDAAHLVMTAVEFFNFKLLFVLSCVVLSVILMHKVDILIVLAALVIGYILPDIWVSRMIKKYKSEIVRNLPETVDLLGLCIEGGLDFTSAMKWIIEKTFQNQMIKELAFVSEEVSWGKPRVQALKDMSARLNIPEVSTFVHALVQAERLGTPVHEVFAIISEDTRIQRRHQGERFAMTLQLKILIPLIFCIMPVIGIIIGGPILLSFTQGGMLKGM